MKKLRRFGILYFYLFYPFNITTIIIFYRSSYHKALSTLSFVICAVRWISLERISCVFRKRLRGSNKSLVKVFHLFFLFILPVLDIAIILEMIPIYFRSCFLSSNFDTLTALYRILVNQCSLIKFLAARKQGIQLIEYKVNIN